MGVVFEQLRLSGWKSIRELSLDLRPLTVLVGGNGAGKSNLIDFFKLLNEMVGDRLQERTNTIGGPEALFHYGTKVTLQLSCELRFRSEQGLNWYSAAWLPARPQGLVFESERVSYLRPDHPDPYSRLLGGGHLETRLAESGPTASFVRGALTRCRVFHFHDTSPAARFRNDCPVNMNRQLFADGGNLAAMLYLYRERYPTTYRRVRAAVRAILPEFDDFALEPLRLRPTDILLEWRQVGRDYVFGPHQLSDGTIRFMALATLLLQPTADLPALILLDEPELGLHPAALAVLADLVGAAAKSCQVLLTTQSATLLDHFDPADVVTVNRRDGASVFERLDPERLKEWRDGEFSLSDLWQRNVFGGGPY